MSCSCPLVRNSMLKTFDVKRARRGFHLSRRQLWYQNVMQMCLPHLSSWSPTHVRAATEHLGIKTSRLREGENMCLTCCHRGLKSESRSQRPSGRLLLQKDSGIQTDGPSETSVSACVTEERLMLHFRTDVCGSRKPSEINGKKTWKALKAGKKCVQPLFLLMGYMQL